MDEFKSSTNSTERENNNARTVPAEEEDPTSSPQAVSSTSKRPIRRRRLAHRRQYAKSRRVASSFLRSQFVRYDILSRKFNDEDESIDEWYKVQTIDADCSSRTATDAGNVQSGLLRHCQGTDDDQFKENRPVEHGFIDAGQQDENLPQKFTVSEWILFDEQQQKQQQQQNLNQSMGEIDFKSEHDNSDKNSHIRSLHPSMDSTLNLSHDFADHQKHHSTDMCFTNYNSSSLDSSYSMPTDGNNNLTDPLVSSSTRQPRISPLASIPNSSHDFLPHSDTSNGGRKYSVQRQPKSLQHPERQQTTTLSNHHHQQQQPSRGNQALPVERVVRSETIDLNQIGRRQNSSTRSKKFSPLSSFNLSGRQQLSQFDLSSSDVNRFVSMQRLSDREVLSQRHKLKEEAQDVSLVRFHTLDFLFYTRYTFD